MRGLVIAAAFVAAACLLPAAPAAAQSQIVGTWVETSSTLGGRPTERPQLPDGVERRPTHFIFTGDGHYMFLTVPRGRPPAKPLAERSKEDWALQYSTVGAQYGTYVVSGSTLTIKVVEALGPQNEGREWTGAFQVGDDTLTIISEQDGQKAESRYRRVK